MPKRESLSSGVWTRWVSAFTSTAIRCKASMHGPKLPESLIGCYRKNLAKHRWTWVSFFRSRFQTAAAASM